MTDHLLWRLRNNDTAKDLCRLAADEIERLRRPTSSRREVLEEAARVARIMGVAASRIGTRVEAILERDGSLEKAITGPGVGISYLLAKELHSALMHGEASIRALAEEK